MKTVPLFSCALCLDTEQKGHRRAACERACLPALLPGDLLSEFHLGNSEWWEMASRMVLFFTFE